jgi:CRP-like cAMP-binding protein
MGHHVGLNARTVIERNRLFRGLPGATLDRIATLATRRPYRKGEVIFAQADSGSGLYGIVTGRVRISNSSPDGKELFLNIMEPGDSFGEIGLLDGRPRTATASATMPSEVMLIQRDDFLGLLRQEPELVNHVLRLLCERLRWMSGLTEESALLAVPARVARRLLSLAAVHGQSIAGGVRMAISQEELARFIGLSRQIVNQHLQQWKSKGWVTLGRGSITIRDQRALQSMVSGDGA